MLGLRIILPDNDSLVIHDRVNIVALRLFFRDVAERNDYPDDLSLLQDRGDFQKKWACPKLISLHP